MKLRKCGGRLAQKSSARAFPNPETLLHTAFSGLGNALILDDETVSHLTFSFVELCYNGVNYKIRCVVFSHSLCVVDGQFPSRRDEKIRHGAGPKVTEL